MRKVTGDRTARQRVTSRGIEAHVRRINGRRVDRTKPRRAGTHAHVTDNINCGIRAIYCYN
jgi:hypothetical protein